MRSAAAESEELKQQLEALRQELKGGRMENREDLRAMREVVRL